MIAEEHIKRYLRFIKTGLDLIDKFKKYDISLSTQKFIDKIVDIVLDYDSKIKKLKASAKSEIAEALPDESVMKKLVKSVNRSISRLRLQEFKKICFCD